MSYSLPSPINFDPQMPSNYYRNIFSSIHSKKSYHHATTTMEPQDSQHMRRNPMVCTMKLHQETSLCEVQIKMNPIKWCSPLLPPPPQWHIQEPQAPRRRPPIHMIVAIRIVWRNQIRRHQENSRMPNMHRPSMGLP
jgi:hypothetical protein